MSAGARRSPATTGATYVALFRGINVGRAKRVKMEVLRSVCSDLGFGDVRTLLNSGNVVFSAAGVSADEAATRIEEALPRRVGFTARTIVLTAVELASAVDGNPLLDIADNPSRLLVAVLQDETDGALLVPLLDRDWAPEALAVGGRFAYLWCPGGSLAGELAEAVGRALGDRVTTRNWATITKLHALASA